jgi:hypothetical protein
MEPLVKIIFIFFCCLLIGRFLIWWITKRFTNRGCTAKKLSLKDFNQVSLSEKNRLFIEWCKRKDFDPAEPKTETQLFDYVTDFKLPTLYDWKLIHKYPANHTVNKRVYNNWLKFIGAANTNGRKP